MKKIIFTLILCLNNYLNIYSQTTAGTIVTVSPNPQTPSSIFGNNIVVFKPSDGDFSSQVDSNATGTVYTLGPGVYNISNFFRIPTNGGFVGAGKNATKVITWYSNSVAAATFRITDNNYIGGMTIYCGYHEVSGGAQFQVPIGLDSTLSDSPSTNFVVDSVALWGQTDNVVINHAAKCTGQFWNCDFNSSWDFNVLKGAGGNKFDYYNCHFENFTNLTGNGNNNRKVFASDASSSGQIVRLFGGYINLTNAPSNLARVIVSSSSGTSWEFHNVTVTNLSTAGSDVSIDTGDTFVNDGSTIHPSRIAHNGGTLLYAARSTGPLIFGGSLDDGTGPIISSSDVNTLNYTANSNFFAHVVSIGANGLQYGTCPINTNFIATSAGTVYTLTASYALLDFGTTDPAITIQNTGNYLVTGKANFITRGATYAATNTYSLKLRKTSGTPADLSGSEAVQTINIITTTTEDLGIIDTRPVIFSAIAGDVVQLWGVLSATPSVGNVICDRADVIAIRLY